MSGNLSRYLEWLSCSIVHPSILRATDRNRFLRFIRGRSAALLSPLFPKEARWVRIRSGILGGHDIYAELRQGEKCYWLGTFEPDLQSAVEALAVEFPNVSCIYDIGAHIGFVSMLFAKCFPSAHIFAFEPNPSNYRRLALNINRNKLDSRITPVEQALSDSSHFAQFFIGGSSWSGSLLPSHRDYDSNFNIATATLDDMVYRDGYPPPGVMKIDVEGAEDSVLRGSTRILKDYKPILIIEIHYAEGSQAVVRMLKQMGYRMNNLGGRGEWVDTRFGPGHLLARQGSR